MTLQAVPGGGVIALPNYQGITHNTSLLADGLWLSALDAADEAFAQIFPLTKAGTLSKIHIMTGDYNAGPEDVDVRLESLDTAGNHGNPSGNLFTANANGTATINAANTWFEASLNGGSGVTITSSDLGSLVAVVVVAPNPLVNAGNFEIACGYYSGYRSQPEYYTTWMVQKIGGSYGTHYVTRMVLRLEYDDGSFAYVPNCIPSDSKNATSVVYDTEDDPDECGVKLRFPFTFRAVGCWVNPQLNEDGKIYVREGDSTKKGWAAGWTWPEEWLYSSGYKMIQPAWFDTPFTVAKDTWYRITVAATHASSTIGYYYMPLATAAHWGTLGLSQADYLWCEQKDDSGSWTDTTGRVPFAGFIADQFDDATGGGGGGGSCRIIGG